MRALSLLMLLAAACSSADEAPKAPVTRPAPTFAVEVAPVESRALEYSVSAVGSVEPFERVQVSVRVGGALERVRFREGDPVQAGSVLARVDPARFEIAHAQARAQLQRAQASVREATDALGRREAANAQSPGLITEDEIAQLRTRLAVLEADAAIAQVALDAAALDLKDASVRAPVAGIIETKNAQTGQFVQPGTVLATLVQREPLLLRFKVTDTDARALSVGMPAFFRVRGQQQTFRATITHVSKAADPSSRMVQVSASIDDEGRDTLVAGTFAEVRVPSGGESKSTVVPQVAVRPSERGFLSYVVEDGKTARERVVTLGLRTDDGLVQVTHGLSEGETLVVRGSEALRDGAQVRIVTPAPAQMPAEGSLR